MFMPVRRWSWYRRAVQSEGRCPETLSRRLTDAVRCLAGRNADHGLGGRKTHPRFPSGLKQPNVEDPFLKPSTFLAAALITAISGTALAQQPVTLSIATGNPANPYHKKCEALQGELKGKIDVTCVPPSDGEPAGTINNFERLDRGVVNAAIVQINLYQHYERQVRALPIKMVAPLLNEAVHVICNRESDIDDFDDFIEKKPVTLIGDYGTGAQATWESWFLQDDRFIDGWANRTRNIGGPQALLEVSNGKNAQCMVTVAKPGADSVRFLNDQSRGKVKLIDFYDETLAESFKDPDGDPVYSLVTIDGGTYSNMNPSGFLSSGDVETLGTAGVLVVTKEFIQSRRAMNDLSTAILKVAE